MKIRQFAMRALGAVAVVAAATTGAAGVASADTVPLQAVWIEGASDIVVGQNAWCNGIVDTGVEVDPARPGFATIVISSRGMHGIGPEWAQNPRCKATWTVLADNGLFTKTPAYAFPTEFGEQPETVRKEFWFDHGLTGFTLGLTFVDPATKQLVPQFGYPGNIAYAILP